MAPTYRDDWFVEAEWRDPATGATHSFKSERLSRADAERYAARSPITVLIDPIDPGSYYVEIARWLLGADARYGSDPAANGGTKFSTLAT